MPIIIITGEPTEQRALMYSRIGKRGLRKMVTTYRALVEDNDGELLFEFAVTRKSRREVFKGGKPRDYRIGNECPPHVPGRPYLGRITRTGRLGFSIILYEEWCPNRETLRGEGQHKRTGIKIHHGPATSLGCMAVAGAKKGYRRFVRAFKVFEEKYGPVFKVLVFERTD